MKQARVTRLINLVSLNDEKGEEELTRLFKNKIKKKKYLHTHWETHLPVRLISIVDCQRGMR